MEEDLTTVVKSLTKVNNALRRVIRRGADEVGQQELFEEKFKSTENKFHQFKEFVRKNDEQAAALASRLEHEVSRHRQNAESLRREIESLNEAVAAQTLENEQLVGDLSKSVNELHKVRQNPYMNTKSPQPFIQRLQKETQSSPSPCHQ